MARTITVQASGEVLAEPDVVHLSSGVVSDAETAREALRANTETMTKVIAGLKEKGIAAADIQTSSFRVEPRYTVSNASTDNRPPLIAGYRVANQVSVVLRQLDKVGDTLDTLVKLGANQVNGLSFEVSKADSLKDEARKAAVANARRRAELLAEAAGARLGEVVQIAEDVQQVSGIRPMLAAGRARGAPVPIESGTETLVANVTITWALK